MKRWLPILLTLVVAAPAQAAGLRAGAGRADITPPQTGYYLGGWTRADRLGTGVSTRIFANALVLQRGKRKVALVAAELFGIPAGLQEDVARKVADLGYDKTTILLAASHTHSGPGGFFNNPTYNTAAPSPQTIDDPLSFEKFLNPDPANKQLYTFMVDQIAQAVRRADAKRHRAVAAWGHSRLVGLTQNRSIEAFLANYGIKNLAYGQGSPDMDPKGPVDTIDPNVDVLRVDRVGRHGRRVPIGAWSNFADHGTVVHSEFEAYSGDHHASAWRHFAARVHKATHSRRAFVDVYPNSNEGDQTAGIVNVGPAAADRVGSVEAKAMFRAWRAAGHHLRRRLAVAGLWTRTCFCGRMTATGPVDTSGKEGAGFLTGSEEGRGPLYDITGVPLEGQTSADTTPTQGDKYVIPGAGNPPPAVPISLWRIGDHAVIGVPGEATKEEGLHIQQAVLKALPVKRAVIAGLADDYVQYITTPAEYGWQSYEGASTLWGPNEGTFLVERYAELARDLAGGQPAPKPYALDTSYGIKPDGSPYPDGAASGAITAQPAAAVERLKRATLAFTGAPSGHDLPTDRAFLTAQRRIHGHWRSYANDLGLEFLWRADDAGHYTVEWEIPLTAPRGTYRLRVTARRYALTSHTFKVTPATSLKLEAVPGGVRLAYPAAQVNVDLTSRPVAANGGRLVASTGTLKRARGTVFALPGGATVAAGAARDRYGNVNGAAYAGS